MKLTLALLALALTSACDPGSPAGPVAGSGSGPAGGSSVVPGTATAGNDSAAREIRTALVRWDLAQIAPLARALDATRTLEQLRRLDERVRKDEDASLRALASALRDEAMRSRDLVDRIARAIERGTLKGRKVVLDDLEHFDVELDGIEAEGLLCRVTPRPGQACCPEHTSPMFRRPRVLVRAWSLLSPLDRLALLEALAPEPASWLAAARHLEFLGAVDLAERALTAAWRGDEARRDEVARELSRVRGEALPPGGYADSPAGLASAEDSLKLAEGFVRVSGRWVPAAQADQARAPWHRLDRGPWAVEGDIEPARLERIADMLLALTPRLTHDLGEQAEGPPLRAVVCATQAKCVQLLRRSWMSHKAQLHPSGWVDAGSRTMIAFDRGPGTRDLARQVAHTAAQLWYEARLPAASEPPYWLLEGIGCTYEGIADGAEAPDTPALRVCQLARLVAEGRLKPLAQMADTDLEELVGADPVGAGAFQAQAWAMVRVLAASPAEERRGALAALLKGVRSDYPLDDVTLKGEVERLVNELPPRVPN